MNIQLIVGLANPLAEYGKTRHNAGAWLLEALAEKWGVTLRAEKKFHGALGLFQIGNLSVRLLIPSYYMNQNGICVAAVAKFYNILPQSILVAHDELDFPAGVVRLKEGGGHGGHNGLRNVIDQLKSNEFRRVRIGIDHPGDRNKVHDYVLGPPSSADRMKIIASIDQVNAWMEKIVEGHIQDVMQALH